MAVLVTKDFLKEEGKTLYIKEFCVVLQNKKDTITMKKTEILTLISKSA